MLGREHAWIGILTGGFDATGCDIPLADDLPAGLSGRGIMRIALYQPEIPGNVGAVLRIGACFDVGIDLIEPIGFPFSDARLRRSAMDYIEAVRWQRHGDFAAFRAATPGRLLLLTTRAAEGLYTIRFRPDDVLMFGSESAGVPPEIADAADARIRIPIAAGVRSLNLSVAAAISVAEALRQTGGFPS